MCRVALAGAAETQRSLKPVQQGPQSHPSLRFPLNPPGLQPPGLSIPPALWCGDLTQSPFPPSSRDNNLQPAGEQAQSTGQAGWAFGEELREQPRGSGLECQPALRWMRVALACCTQPSVVSFLLIFSQIIWILECNPASTTCTSLRAQTCYRQGWGPRSLPSVVPKHQVRLREKDWTRVGQRGTGLQSDLMGQEHRCAPAMQSHLRGWGPGASTSNAGWHVGPLSPRPGCLLAVTLQGLGPRAWVRAASTRGMLSRFELWAHMGTWTALPSLATHDFNFDLVRMPGLIQTDS